MIPPWIGLPSSVRPTTTPRMPKAGRERAAPLLAPERADDLDGASKEDQAPSAVTVANVAITGDPRRIVPSTIRAIPRPNSQSHLPRIAWSS